MIDLLGALPGEFGHGRPACDAGAGTSPSQRRDLAELFWPISELDEHQIRRAKGVCRTCPIQGSCLQFALRNGEDAGVWGGLTAPERRRLRAVRGGDGAEEVAA